MHFHKPSKYSVFLTVLIIGILTDQLFKYLYSHSFIAPCNPGIAFGIDVNGIFFTVLVLFLMGILFFREKNKFSVIAISLIFAGGFSNLFDRLAFGCVRDFIRTFWWFPVFNIADATIVLGGFLLFVNMFRGKFKFER